MNRLEAYVTSIGAVSIMSLFWMGGSPPGRAAEFTPPDRGKPGRLEGAGTRLFEPPSSIEDGRNRGCSLNGDPDDRLTPLAPSSGLSVTVSSHPTFFVYVPESPEGVQAEFILFDRAQNEVYSQTITVDKTPGLLSVSLPETAPPLETGQPYQWFVSLICNRDDRAGDAVIGGWIQRLEPTEEFARDLENANPVQRAALYAETGIWQDAVATLAHLLQSSQIERRGAVKAEWEELLTSVGLSEMAQVRWIDPTSGDRPQELQAN